MKISKVDNTANLASVNSPEDIRQKRVFVWFCGNALKKIMIDFGIDNIRLSELSGQDRSNVSKLRNGNLSQRNYIKMIRALPEAARTEYLNVVFFSAIPDRLPPEIEEIFERKARANKDKKSLQTN